MLTRRRFIAISAAVAALPQMGRAAPAPTPRLRAGQALGAQVSIRIAHPDGDAIAARVLSEIDRLEGILSLYRPDSALARLNRDGELTAPPFELLECLSLAGAVHRESGGRFDPTVQPLWSLWAEAAVAGGRPDDAAIRGALARTGWEGVRMDSTRITLRPGMALTLNGIGQGYVADRVAALLKAEGLSEVLIDTGELRALGGQPGGGAWQVKLEAGGRVALQDRALATSAPLGTTFDQAGTDGHIMDPATGRPTPATWREITISAQTAALADALSTAGCLTPDEARLQALVSGFPGAKIEAATRA
ncbi:FAD:protein FMN transferase [Paracoccus sp. Z118]|uniref:FAD:protein FMN transferase n=1 Tax=Paracoccus sp. Z118 TaxID=2851017 RepID=UPI001C2C7F65|nr:FAD:protein FMN transferase [Paracoccus sp. Z118]MBV0892370.1 FAD:protein FMN transferase [Paracoccus sp. Z118]